MIKLVEGLERQMRSVERTVAASYVKDFAAENSPATGPAR